MKSKKQLFVSLSLIVLLIISAIFIVYRYTIASTVFSPHILPSIDSEVWGQLYVGMDKDDVIALFGDSQSKTSPAQGSKSGYINNEYWEYNWTDGLSGVFGPSLRAYVVYFDDHGKVVSFRKPIKQ